MKERPTKVKSTLLIIVWGGARGGSRMSGICGWCRCCWVWFEWHVVTIFNTVVDLIEALVPLKLLLGRGRNFPPWSLKPPLPSKSCITTTFGVFYFCTTWDFQMTHWGALEFINLWRQTLLWCICQVERVKKSKFTLWQTSHLWLIKLDAAVSSQQSAGTAYFLLRPVDATLIKTKQKKNIKNTNDAVETCTSAVCHRT